MKTIVRSAVISLVALALSAGKVFAQEAPVGSPAPDFTLSDMNGEKRSLYDFKGKHVVLEWMNYGCPFIRKHYKSGNMQALQKEYAAKGVIWLSICSSAEGKQGHHTPEEWRKLTQENNASPFAVLLDYSGEVGRLYGAKTTPHMFVINPKGTLVYKGAIDDKPNTDTADIPEARNFVRAALDASIAGKKVKVPETNSYGCSVKYK
jgi:peroxiredoxin